MKLIEKLGKLSPPAILLLGLALTVVLAVIDYATGPDISFLVFYFAPVFLVAWYVGVWAGISLSVVSSAVWLLDDVLGTNVYRHPAIPYWNVTIKFAVFVMATLILNALKKALERERAAEAEIVSREVRIAKEVQSRLFPQLLPKMRTLDYSVICKGAREVSGDYYDVLQTSSTELFFAIGDVSGKGIPAALLMASLQASVRSRLPLQRASLSETILQINCLLCQWTDGSKFTSLFAGIYDDDERTLTYVNAGHNPPIVMQPAGTSSDPSIPGDRSTEESKGLLRLSTGGPVLGLFPETEFEQGTIQLKPGDVLLAFTDGISEAMDGRQELFGEDRLVGVVSKHKMDSPRELRDAILEEIERFTGGEQQDDITLFVGKFS
jgi:serine phosphatase RsbU (regulator of sigma subunit)